MIVRSTFYKAMGGDTVQVLQTAAHLAMNGVLADIKLTDEPIDYNLYDLLHFFNLTRPSDILTHVRRGARPFLVSTIFIDYSEYDKCHRTGISGTLFKFVSTDGAEYLKTISRWLLGKDKLISASFIWKGQRQSIREILKKAALLLPNSRSEYQRLLLQYNCAGTHVVVPNAVDAHLFSYNPAVEKDPQMVLCVARIEGVKNQLNLIRALKDTNFHLYIIGTAAGNQTAYYRDCRRLATKNIHFIEQLPQQELVSYYEKAKVHVLPSWFETTGLSSLEAATMGCNVVISNKGDTQEYFGNDATYCDPGSPESIYQSIKTASTLPRNKDLQQRILLQYSWQQATMRTMEAYKQVKNIWD